MFAFKPILFSVLSRSEARGPGGRGPGGGKTAPPWGRGRSDPPTAPALAPALEALGEEEVRAVARSPLSLRPGHRQSAFVPPTCLDLAQPATQRGRPHCGGRETRPRGRRLPAEPRLAAERRPAPRLRHLTLRASWLWGPSRDVPRRCHQAGVFSSADVFTALSAAQAPSGGVSSCVCPVPGPRSPPCVLRAPPGCPSSRAACADRQRPWRGRTPSHRPGSPPGPRVPSLVAGC